MALLELVTLLPPGAPSQTRLARHGHRLVVLRELRPGTTCFRPKGGAPRVAALEEVGELQGKRHALFPFVPGVSLRDIVRAFESVGKLVPLAFSGAVVLQAARALAALSPPRVHGGLADFALQVGFDGEVWVLDFGAPRASRYLAPGPPGPSSDVFSLAAVLHSTLTGFEGVYGRVAVSPPSSSHPDASPALDDVLRRALSLSPEQRPPDVGAFADELEVVLGPSVGPAELASVVTSLFPDRLALLESISGSRPAGLALGAGEDPRTEAHAVPPQRLGASISDATQPGSVADGGGRQLAWLPEAGGADDDASSLFRAAEDSTSPGVVAPPPGPRITASGAMRGVGLMPSANEGTELATAGADGADQAPDEATQAGQPPPRASSPPRPATSPPRPSTSPPRPSGAQARLSEGLGPRVGAPALEERPASRASVPTRASAPRATRPPPPVPDVAAGEGASSTNEPAELGDELVEVAATALRPRLTGPVAEPSLPRNTTDFERQRAVGQERVVTPPMGTPAVGARDEDGEALGDEFDAPPTAIRPRAAAAQAEVTTAQTVQKLKTVPADVAPEGDEDAAPRRRGRGLIAVLLVVIAVLAGVAAMKRGEQQAVDVAEDTGAPETMGLLEDAGASDALDAGAVFSEGDVADAGAGQAVADGGGAEADAGAATVAVDGDGGVEAVGRPDAGRSGAKASKKKKRRR